MTDDNDPEEEMARLIEMIDENMTRQKQDATIQDPPEVPPVDGYVLAQEFVQALSETGELLRSYTIRLEETAGGDASIQTEITLCMLILRTSSVIDADKVLFELQNILDYSQIEPTHQGRAPGSGVRKTKSHNKWMQGGSDAAATSGVSTLSRLICKVIHFDLLSAEQKQATVARAQQLFNLKFLTEAKWLRKIVQKYHKYRNNSSVRPYYESNLELGCVQEVVDNRDWLKLILIYTDTADRDVKTLIQDSVKGLGLGRIQTPLSDKSSAPFVHNPTILSKLLMIEHDSPSSVPYVVQVKAVSDNPKTLILPNEVFGSLFVYEYLAGSEYYGSEYYVQYESAGGVQNISFVAEETQDGKKLCIYLNKVTSAAELGLTSHVLAGAGTYGTVSVFSIRDKHYAFKRFGNDDTYNHENKCHEILYRGLEFGLLAVTCVMETSTLKSRLTEHFYKVTGLPVLIMNTIENAKPMSEPCNQAPEILLENMKKVVAVAAYIQSIPLFYGDWKPANLIANEHSVMIVDIYLGDIFGDYTSFHEIMRPPKTFSSLNLLTKNNKFKDSDKLFMFIGSTGFQRNTVWEDIEKLDRSLSDRLENPFKFHLDMLCLYNTLVAIYLYNNEHTIVKEFLQKYKDVLFNMNTPSAHLPPQPSVLNGIVQHGGTTAVPAGTFLALFAATITVAASVVPRW
jgi:hypothetical protein